jgi:hypothetical protein
MESGQILTAAASQWIARRPERRFARRSAARVRSIISKSSSLDPLSVLERLRGRAEQLRGTAREGLPARDRDQDRSAGVSDAKFVNEAEESFAKLLDVLGIPWAYEPTAFDLETDEEGKITFGFRPDFYLPDRDLYIELTLRRDLARKNRQLRYMQERFPNVRVVLLGRKDLLALHEPHVVGSDGLSSAAPSKKVLTANSDGWAS